jgi:cysteine desulfurase
MAVYLDHNATTPLAPEVVEAMTAALRDVFGNASSVHRFGQRARAAVDDARAAVAALIGADPVEVVFTSGGTEADNFALRGAADVLGPAGRTHLVVSAIEHEAVLQTARSLQKRGWDLTLVPVDASGVVSAQAVCAAVRADTALVSVMHANNEIGTIQPIVEIAAAARARGALVHTDAVQTVGKIPVEVGALGVDLLSLTAHKFHGPKGAGALWIRRGVKLAPLLTGGRQERSRRAGTENVLAIVGLGAAARLAAGKLAMEGTRQAALRDRLERGILEGIRHTTAHGAAAPRVPNTTNISFEGVEAEALLIALDLEDIAVSTGSACSSGTLEPSHVLRAMGLSAHRVQSSLRFSLGQGTTATDIDRVLAVLPGLVERLRNLG